MTDLVKMREILLKRAGLTPELILTGRNDATFEEILEIARQIHKGKEVLYGNYLETHGSDPTDFALMEHFCDVKRKYVRLEHFVKKRVSGEDIKMGEHLDSLMDILVYAAMGIQLAFHLMERELDSGFRSGDDRTSDTVKRPSPAAGDRPGGSYSVRPDPNRTLQNRPTDLPGGVVPRRSAEDNGDQRSGPGRFTDIKGFSSDPDEGVSGI